MWMTKRTPEISSPLSCAVSRDGFVCVPVEILRVVHDLEIQLVDLPGLPLGQLRRIVDIHCSRAQWR